MSPEPNLPFAPDDGLEQLIRALRREEITLDVVFNVLWTATVVTKRIDETGEDDSLDFAFELLPGPDGRPFLPLFTSLEQLELFYGYVPPVLESQIEIWARSASAQDWPPGTVAVVNPGTDSELVLDLQRMAEVVGGAHIERIAPEAATLEVRDAAGVSGPVLEAMAAVCARTAGVEAAYCAEVEWAHNAPRLVVGAEFSGQVDESAFLDELISAGIAAGQPMLDAVALRALPEGHPVLRHMRDQTQPFYATAEQLPTFAAQLKRHLEDRFGGLRDPQPEVRYALDPRRLAETDPVEEIAWAFRCSEILASQSGEGLGRARHGHAPRLTLCVDPPRFRKRGMEHIAVVSRLCDELLAWGYEVGIGREAEGLAELRVNDAVDPTVAWETVVALCGCPNDRLGDLLCLEHESLKDVQALAHSNVASAARHFGLRPRRELNATATLLVNAGLLMRRAQHDDGPELHAAIAPEVLTFVRGRWPSPTVGANS